MIVLTPFARTRLFPREQRRNAIQDCTADAFERYLNDHEPLKLLDGYAPFCKLHVHANWHPRPMRHTPRKNGRLSAPV